MEKLINGYDSKPEDFDRLFSSTLAKRNDNQSSANAAGQTGMSIQCPHIINGGK